MRSRRPGPQLSQGCTRAGRFDSSGPPPRSAKIEWLRLAEAAVCCRVIYLEEPGAAERWRQSLDSLGLTPRGGPAGPFSRHLGSAGTVTVRMASSAIWMESTANAPAVFKRSSRLSRKGVEPPERPPSTGSAQGHSSRFLCHRLWLNSNQREISWKPRARDVLDWATARRFRDACSANPWAASPAVTLPVSSGRSSGSGRSGNAPKLRSGTRGLRCVFLIAHRILKRPVQILPGICTNAALRNCLVPDVGFFSPCRPRSGRGDVLLAREILVAERRSGRSLNPNEAYLSCGMTAVARIRKFRVANRELSGIFLLSGLSQLR